MRAIVKQITKIIMQNQNLGGKQLSICPRTDPTRWNPGRWLGKFLKYSANCRKPSKILTSSKVMLISLVETPLVKRIIKITSILYLHNNLDATENNNYSNCNFQNSDKSLKHINTSLKMSSPTKGYKWNK